MRLPLAERGFDAGGESPEARLTLPRERLDGTERVRIDMLGGARLKKDGRGDQRAETVGGFGCGSRHSAGRGLVDALRCSHPWCAGNERSAERAPERRVRRDVDATGLFMKRMPLARRVVASASVYRASGDRLERACDVHADKDRHEHARSRERRDCLRSRFGVTSGVGRVGRDHGERTRCLRRARGQSKARVAAGSSSAVARPNADRSSTVV